MKPEKRMSPFTHKAWQFELSFVTLHLVSLNQLTNSSIEHRRILLASKSSMSIVFPLVRSILQSSRQTSGLYHSFRFEPIPPIKSRLYSSLSFNKAPVGASWRGRHNEAVPTCRAHRRRLSASRPSHHGHLDQPKPGEEYSYPTPSLLAYS